MVEPKDFVVRTIIGISLEFEHFFTAIVRLVLGLGKFVAIY